MEEAVVLSACRTPIGKFHGALSALSAPELGGAAIRAAVRQSGVEPEQVDEVIMGNVLSAGLGQAPARQAALLAGLPPAVAALTINKVCGSGLKAVMLAAQAIRGGEADVIVAGGMEAMSRAPYLLPRGGPRFGDLSLHDSMLHDGLTCASSAESMGSIAERLAAAEAIWRDEQDGYAAESHRRALAAAAAGEFAAEIVPVEVRSRRGPEQVAADEGPRPGTSVESLAKLPPAFAADGSVTAGNASMISDGAAALVLASEQFAASRGLAPLARVAAWSTAGGPPEDLFTAPVDAVRQTLARAQLPLDQVDLLEINEAFAVQMLACLRGLQLSTERVNVCGGAIALGHPIGASGARVAATLIHSLTRRDARRGVAALCLGGGNAVAALFER